MTNVIKNQEKAAEVINTIDSSKAEKILILDFGGQYNQLSLIHI